MTDRRRRQYVPQDVDFLPTDGHRIYQTWDFAGVVAWQGFLAACQRSTTQGELRWRTEDEAQALMGLAGYELPFTIAEFFVWTGKQRFGQKRWTTTTRRGTGDAVIHKTVDNRWAERQPRRHEATKQDTDTPRGHSSKGAAGPPHDRVDHTAVRIGGTSAAHRRTSNRRSDSTDTAPPSPHLTSPPDSEGKSGGEGDSPARASAAEPSKGSAASRSGRRRKNRPPTIPVTAVPPSPDPAPDSPPPAEPVPVSSNGHTPPPDAAALIAQLTRPTIAPPPGADPPPPRPPDRAATIAAALAAGDDPQQLARHAAERGWDLAALGLPAPAPELTGHDPPPEAFA